MPLVSIVLLSRDYARYLPDALASVRAQTCPDWEVVAVDDASADGSAELLRRFADEGGDRCRLILRSRPAGCSAGYNDALAVARGRYVAFLSADDVLAPDRLERQTAALEADPHLRLCH